MLQELNHKQQEIIPSTTDNCPWCGGAISRKRFDAIAAKIRQQEQVSLAESAKQLRSQLETEHAAELTRQRQLSEQLLEATLQAKLKEIDAERQKLYADQVGAMCKDRDELVLKTQSDFNRERESLQAKIKDMERALLKNTSPDMGDAAEIDLFKTLSEAFPTDCVSRVQKGQPGADIHLDVIHKGQPCGKIIFEAKNVKAWQNAFVTKLRGDQLKAGAEHAVLVSTVFPRGQRDLCIESDVIIVNPGRATHIVAVLRRSIVALHLRGVSMTERTSKMSELYALISSDKYKLRFRELERLTNDIVSVDSQEKRSHETIWKKRGSLTTRLAAALAEIDSDVADVIEAQEQTDLSVAS